MKRWHKFVLVLSVFSVLFSSLAVSSFADSAMFSDSDLQSVTYIPFFSPYAIELSGEDVYVTIDLGTTYTVNEEFVGDVVVASTLLEDYDVNAMGNFYNTTTLSSYRSIDGDDVPYFNSFYRFELEYSFSNLVLHFNDFFFDSPDYSSNNLDSVFQYLVRLNTVGFSSTNYVLTYDAKYLNSFNELSTDNGIVYGDLDDIFGNLASELYSSYPSGALISDVTLYCTDSPVDSFTLTNNYLCGDVYLKSAGYNALDAWSDRFGGDVIVEYDSPTILESVQLGLDAVWNTSLFGLFTIGQVFSACAGLALFTWLLKIFNR